MSYNLDEDILRPPHQGWIAGDYEFDPEEPPPLMEAESDNEEELQGTAESDSDSETEELISEEARTIFEQFEQCLAAAEPVELPHVKRWEGEPEPSVATADLWRSRAKAGNFKEVKIPLECYVGGATECPRSGPEYANACLSDMHLPVPGGEVTDDHRKVFPDLTDVEIRAVADMISRKAAVMWREGTPQTTVVGFLHDMVVKGGPISLPPICRRGEAADWVEEKIRKDYARGQLVPGSSPWGSPAFRVSAKGRKDRLVVDYRRVHALTERATFLLRDFCLFFFFKCTCNTSSNLLIYFY